VVRVTLTGADVAAVGGRSAVAAVTADPVPTVCGVLSLCTV
jgi:hypothetical protein